MFLSKGCGNGGLDGALAVLCSGFGTSTKHLPPPPLCPTPTGFCGSSGPVVCVARQHAFALAPRVSAVLVSLARRVRVRDANDNGVTFLGGDWRGGMAITRSATEGE